MAAYYNEIDPFAAQWLRNLINAGHIAPGDVDTRSIVDVKPSELRSDTQCHFFAGIGVWSRALRQAGWQDDQRVWTGSCPCQPFSSAGQQVGVADERHLWPALFHLIQECRPAVIFGEQVEAAINHGWLDLVQADLEGVGYAFAAAGLPAAGFGAPHIRQRLFFVGHSDDSGLEGRPWRHQAASRVGQASAGPTTEAGKLGHPRQTNGFWAGADWLECRDGKWRPVEPGAFPLADRAPNRVGALRAYGNAISPQVAEAFIKSFMECS